MRKYLLILLVEDNELRADEIITWLRHERPIVHAEFGEKAARVPR